MLHAKEVTVSPKGIRIGQDAMTRIGVADESVCWGLWVPDRGFSKQVTSPPKNAYNHLLISPFEPSSWPVLLRLEIYLKDDFPGTLAAALQPLKNLANIVSLEVAPAGHHHAIVTVICEDANARQVDGPLNDLRNLAENKRTFNDDDTWSKVHDNLATHMLGKSREIENAIRTSDKVADPAFLRETFLDPKDNNRWERGALYSAVELPESVRSEGEGQSTPAVKCTWLQNLAFFWLYGSDPAKNSIELKYDGRTEFLKVDKSGDQGFSNGLGNIQLPLRVIASFHHYERFARLVISDEDIRGENARVTIPYYATFNPPFTSQGFQFEVYDRLSHASINIRSASMFTQHSNLESEKGTISLLVSDASHQPEFTLKDLKNQVSAAATFAAEAISSNGLRMTCGAVTVKRLSARRLFFSTKFDWLDDSHPELVRKLRKHASVYGFELLTAANGTKNEMDSLVPEAKSDSIMAWTTNLIRNSDAFLQLIPRSAKKKVKDGELNWLEYEFGAAQALALPCAVMVDLSGGMTIDSWQTKLRVGKGLPMYPFNSDRNDRDLIKALKDILVQLSLAR